MKNITQKYSSPDKGIAIMFSLIMLSVFFLIAFGFVSMATTAKSASKAREPSQDTSTTASESVLNEALACIEERLYSGGAESPDTALFKPLRFSNGTTDVDMQVWGLTGDSGNTDLEDALLLQFDPSGADTELKINTTFDAAAWNKYGWKAESATNHYSWIVIESNGLDPNYLGAIGTGGADCNNRNGFYTRELDMNLIDSTNAAALYQDWSGAPWESKKQLIGALASNYETAVSLYQTNTSPIEMEDFTSRFDLKSINNGTALSTITSGITWLNGNNQIAANIKDYIDDDIECTVDGDTAGVERTPQINELAIVVENTTVDPPTDPMTGNATAPTLTSLTLQCQGEFIDMFRPSNTGAWGTTTGSQARLELEVTVRATRGSDSINTNGTLVVNQTDLSGGFTYLSSSDVNNTGVAEANVVTGGNVQELAEFTNVSVTITKATLFGDSGGSEVWDIAALDVDSGSTDLDSQEIKYISFEVSDPRVNHSSTSWRNNGWNIELGTATNILQSKNGINTGQCDPTSWDDLETATEPRSISTAFMPDGGGITNVSELGLISRGEVGKTLNLVDYDFVSPTQMANYKPTSNFGLQSLNNSNGGDRAILDFVRVTSGDNYRQFSCINPNTTNFNVLRFLFSGVISENTKDAAISSTEIDKIIDRFPGIDTAGALTKDDIFKVTDFQSTANGHHNRNPKSFGYPFSRFTAQFTANPDTLTDAHREALITKSLRLVSPKYSYYTILTTVKDPTTGPPVTVSSYYNFVRRENESGSYKIIFQITP